MSNCVCWIEVIHHLQLPLRLFHTPKKYLWWIWGSEKSRKNFWHPHLHWHFQNEALVTSTRNQNLRGLKECKILESKDILEQRWNFPAECGMGVRGGLPSIVRKQGRVCSFSSRLKRCVLTFTCFPQGASMTFVWFWGCTEVSFKERSSEMAFAPADHPIICLFLRWEGQNQEKSYFHKKIRVLLSPTPHMSQSHGQSAPCVEPGFTNKF